MKSYTRVSFARRGARRDAAKAFALPFAITIAAGGCTRSLSSSHSDSPPADTVAGTEGDASAPRAAYQSAPPPQAPGGGDDTSDDSLAVNDTDIYQVAGNRLYYLSNDRGLLVFDVTDVDHPALLGSSPMIGEPQKVYVDGNLVVVVFADWYETTTPGQPFSGSVVRVFDCTDPTTIRVVGQVPVVSYVQDSRLVGGVLYTVGTDQGPAYGAPWVGGMTTSPLAVVTSIAVSSNGAQTIAERSIPGDDAVFAFAPSAIVAAVPSATKTTSTLQYVDISDPGGALSLRGAATIDGIVGTSTGYCSNTGAWALDFADGVHAHAVSGSESVGGGTTLTTVDFSNPDSPSVASAISGLLASSNGQGAVPRFDVDPAGGRALLYLAHSSIQDATSTALDVYDLSMSGSPRQVGTTSYVGDICSLQPSGQQLFTIASFIVDNSAGLDVQQLDVTDPTAPKRLGTATLQANRDMFPAVEAPAQVSLNAAGTRALVPVSVNPPASGPYSYGLQVLTLGSSTLGPIGVANVAAPIRRGLFVQDRAYAFTDQTLSVFDVSNPAVPRPTGSITFASDVDAVQVLGSSIAELSSDYNAPSAPTDVRLLPIASASQASAWATATAVTMPQTAPETFLNGSLLYVSTSSCLAGMCASVSQQISVVDVSSGAPVARGSVELPAVPWKDPYGPYSPMYYGWYTGPDVVQIGSSTLAIRLPNPADPLHIVDLSNPDAPKLANVPVASAATSWWGNMRVFGGTLYVTTAEPSASACPSPSTNGCIAYHVVTVDPKDPAHPVIGAPVSVPGIPFGASSGDPTTLYLSNYVWDSQQHELNEVAVCKLSGGQCSLQGSVQLGGTMGAAFFDGDTAFATITSYDWASARQVGLHQIDLTNPRSPVDRPIRTSFASWGSLLAVSGNEALVTSGWTRGWADVYLLNGTQPPTYQQTLRGLLWSPGMLARQDKTLYLASGPWGVQAIAAP
jgi:hypothetical protein